MGRAEAWPRSSRRARPGRPAGNRRAPRSSADGSRHHRRARPRDRADAERRRCDALRAPRHRPPRLAVLRAPRAQRALERSPCHREAMTGCLGVGVWRRSRRIGRRAAVSAAQPARAPAVRTSHGPRTGSACWSTWARSSERSGPVTAAAPAAPRPTIRCGSSRSRPNGSRAISKGCQPPGARPCSRRVRESITRYRLEARLERQPYTCPFLEPDLTCGLPVRRQAGRMPGVQSRHRRPLRDGRRPFRRRHAHARQGKTSRRGLSRGASRSRSRCSRACEVEAKSVRAPPDRPPPWRGSRRLGRGNASQAHPLPRVLSKCHVASRAEAEALVRAGRVTVNGRRPRRPARSSAPNATASRSTECRSRRLGRARPAPTSSSTSRAESSSTTKDPEGPQDRDGSHRRRPRARARPGRPPRPGQRRRDPPHERSRSRRAPARSQEPRRQDLSREGQGPGHDGDARTDAHRNGREPTASSSRRSAVDVESVGPRSTWLRITLEEGKNRQIRRQCAARTATRSR